MTAARDFHSATIRDDGARIRGERDAIFPWWSFSKTAIAICALKLTESGHVSLDENLPGRPYSLRQLLRNEAGVPDYGPLADYHAAVKGGEAPWSRQTLLDAVKPEELKFPPGTGWAYSNVGYMFAREHLEQTVGLPIGTLFANLISGPLGLSSARFARTRADFADVYWPEGRSYDPGWVYHGCLIGTASDACRLLHALFAGRLVSPSSLHDMLERHHLGGAVPGRPWVSHGYALGLMSGEMRLSGQAIGHSGGGPFSANAVYHFPDRGITAAVFTHGANESLAESEADRLASESGDD